MDAFANKKPRMSAEVGQIYCPSERTPEEVWVSLLFFGLLTMVQTQTTFRLYCN